MSFIKTTKVRIELQFLSNSIYDNTDFENPVLISDPWEACEDTISKLKTFVSNETVGSYFLPSFSSINTEMAWFSAQIEVPDETSSDRLMTKLQNNLDNFTNITLQKAKLVFISNWQRNEEQSE